MFVFFGFHELQGVVELVQAYNLGKFFFVDGFLGIGVWRNIRTPTPVLGRYGHSSSVFVKNGKTQVFVFGGITVVPPPEPTKAASYTLTDSLMSFDLDTYAWYVFFLISKAPGLP